jgi:hypothetical protein
MHFPLVNIPLPVTLRSSSTYQSFPRICWLTPTVGSACYSVVDESSFSQFTRTVNTKPALSFAVLSTVRSITIQHRSLRCCCSAKRTSSSAPVFMGRVVIQSRGKRKGQLAGPPAAAPFTRNDEKDLFCDNVDPNILSLFRRLYSTSTNNPPESCFLIFRATVSKFSLDEIESRGLNASDHRNTNVYDHYIYKLTIPVALQDMFEDCPDEDISLILAVNIANRQWQCILQENHYKCAVCQKNPATRDVSTLSDRLDGDTWRIRKSHCFPICKREKCKHIATKYLDKLDEDPDTPDTSEDTSDNSEDASDDSDDASDTPDDASEDTSDNLVWSFTFCINCLQDDYGGGSKHMNCSACHAVSYCSPECQSEDWTEHKKECKKACKRATCQHCGKRETVRKFPCCASCRQVFYCKERCQVADWANHKMVCIPCDVSGVQRS